jgi:saccharopine dehydrogenase-like NADP-dependent oxidoreductase
MTASGTGLVRDGQVARDVLLLGAAGNSGRLIAAAAVPYVDIANEWPAVRDLLNRGEQARAHGVALVTGAGFGPAATETLVLHLGRGHRAGRACCHRRTAHR